jgi:uncharacterized membrane protein YfcA
MVGLAVLFGCVVGFALGLTGGGGGVLAVPLLVYGLGLPPREAVGVSLAAVGGTALFGVLPRWRKGLVEVRTGLLFAVAGMIGAPIGSQLALRIPETTLLLLFGVLMLVVAWRMWAKSRNPAIPSGTCVTETHADTDRSACQRDSDGQLRMTSRCARLLMFVGLLTGILSGLFGVGGRFVIVPALVLFSGMAIHNAVGTSLLAIFLISVSGVASHVLAGNPMSLPMTLLFLVGGAAGMFLGGLLAKRLSGPTLQQIFAIAVVLVAIFVISKSTLF